MCGRYRLSRRKQFIEEYFATEPSEVDWTPRFNIAPTQPVLTIRQDAKEPIRSLSIMRWGLIPSWAKDSSIGASMINARAETAAAQPAFKDALKLRRCLIPSDGFYEWQKTANGKQPYCFEVNDDRMPVILSKDDYDLWLDPGLTDVAAAGDLLKPFAATLMRRYPVSTRVNVVANGRVSNRSR